MSVEPSHIGSLGSVTSLNPIFIRSASAGGGGGGRANLAPIALSSFESGLAGTSVIAGTLSLSTATPAYGAQNARITTVDTTNGVSLQSPQGLSGVPIAGGQQMTFRYSVRCGTTARNFSIYAQYWDASGAFISQTQGASFGGVLGSYVDVYMVMSAPGTARFVSLNMTSSAVVPAAGEVYDFDKVGVFVGDTIAWSL